MTRAQVLSHQSRRRVAQSPGRQDYENHDANGNRVSGERSRSEQAHDADQTDPAGMRNSKLQDSSDRHLQQAPQDRPLHANLPRQYMNPLRAFQQPIELVYDSNTSPDQSGQRRAGNSKTGKWSPTKNQTGIKHQIDDVRHPKQTHGNGRITGAAEDRVV